MQAIVTTTVTYPNGRDKIVLAECLSGIETRNWQAEYSEETNHVLAAGALLEALEWDNTLSCSGRGQVPGVPGGESTWVHTLAVTAG